jgi:ABC-type nitrate/sulfonate/bicarbonate transport systems, periplasmic components
MKKLTLVLVALAVLLLPCQRAAAADKLTVILDWFVNPDHAPLYVALEKGFFKDRGLEVELIAPSNPSDPAKLVAAGKADIAVSYQHQHQMQVDQGLPLVRIATLIATPLNSLVVLADGPIKNIADLKGKTIGYSVGGFETVLLKVMLARAGLTLDDVKLVNVNFSCRRPCSPARRTRPSAPSATSNSTRWTSKNGPAAPSWWRSTACPATTS